MPIDPSQQHDPNQCGFGLPMDCCVGDAGPSPTEVTTISKSAGKSPAQKAGSGLKIAGGKLPGR